MATTKMQLLLIGILLSVAYGKLSNCKMKYTLDLYDATAVESIYGGVMFVFVPPNFQAHSAHSHSRDWSWIRCIARPRLFPVTRES